MGRYFLIINEKVTDIGCAMVKFYNRDRDEGDGDKGDDYADEDGDDPTFYSVILACNYNTKVYLNHRIYEAGTPCSKCLSGCNRMHHSLCGPDEKVNPHIPHASDYYD